MTHVHSAATLIHSHLKPSIMHAKTPDRQSTGETYALEDIDTKVHMFDSQISNPH